jgi:hypothetical protein
MRLLSVILGPPKFSPTAPSQGYRKLCRDDTAPSALLDLEHHCQDFPACRWGKIICTARVRLTLSFRLVSLDEHRAKFKANLWNRPNHKDKEVTLGLSPEHVAAHKAGRQNTLHKKHSSAAHLESVYSESNGAVPTDVDEVWFAGCHCGAYIFISAIHSFSG